MTENEKEVDEIYKNYLLNDQTDEAKVKLMTRSKGYPNYTASLNLKQQFQQENEEIIHNEDEIETKMNKGRNNHKMTHNFGEIKGNFNDSVKEQNMYSIIANNTFVMRLRVLNMEENILKTYYVNQMIANEKDTWTKIQNIQTCIGLASTVRFEKVENELLVAENLSTELMRKIKEVLNRKAAEKADVQKHEDDIEVPDYRSIVTVRGTKEDVINCIVKATAALENSKYDRAESLLLKAERIFPTKNARDLLKQVRVSKELKQNPELTEKAAKTVEQTYILKNDKLESEMDSVNAAKCVTASEKAFNAGNFIKAERLLHKAKRIKPSLDIEENLSLVKAALVNNIMEEKSKNLLEEANRKRQAAGEHHYKSTKTYDPDESTRIERNSNAPKTFYPSLDSEPHWPKYSHVIASRNLTEEQSKISRHSQPITNTTFEDHIYSFAAGKYHKSTKIYNPNDSTRVTQNLNEPKTFNPCLDLEPHSSPYSPVTASRNSTEEKSIINVRNQPILSTTLEDHLEKSKNKANIQTKNETDRDRFSKYDKKETSNKNKLLDGGNYEHTNVVGYFERENLEESNSKYNAVSNAIKITPKYYAEDYIHMAENAIKDKKLNDAINFLNTAEELKPTPRAKELLKKISNIRLSRDDNVYSNCYRIPVEGNESNKTGASKYIEIAEDGFRKSQYDNAEHFLPKSQRICDNQTIQPNLELIREAKAQNNINVTVKIEKTDNEHFNKHLQDENMNEYNKCTKLVSMYIAEGNLTKAEHFVKKAIRINPNDEAKAQLKLIQDTVASQTSSGVAVISKAAKSEKDLKREKEAEILANLAFRAKNGKNFGAALYYLEWALEKQPNEMMRKRLRNLKEEIVGQKGRHSVNIKLEANKLLNEVLECIRIEDIEKAESLLIISWDMFKTRRTILVYKHFLETRIALYSRVPKNRPAGRNDVKFENILESDKFVKLALKKYLNKQNKEAKELLMTASTLHLSTQIEKLLFEIETKGTDVRSNQSCCNIT